MVQLVIGNKGKGKTKYLLDKVNAEIKTTSGNITYLDKSSKHMFDLNNKVRLINVNDYMISNGDEFLGFVCGILSQDHDLEQMYFDGFLQIACLDKDTIVPVIDKLEKIGETFKVDFIISVSMNEDECPESLKSKIIVSL